jgi:hypothetical protein
MNKMVTVHGFSPEEARYSVKGELQFAYDERFRSRHFAESDADGAEGEGEIEVIQEKSQNARNRLSVRRHSDGPEDSKRLGN